VEVNREAKFGILWRPRFERTVEMTARLRGVKLPPLFGQVRKILRDARPKGFNARIPLPGQRIKARCTDDHQLTFALSSHFPFLAASSPALAVVTWRSECRGEKPVKCNNSKCERNSFAMYGVLLPERERLYETPFLLFLLSLFST